MDFQQDMGAYLHGEEGNDPFGRETAQAYTTEDDDSPWAILSRARMLFVPHDEKMTVLAAHMLRYFDPTDGKPAFSRITKFTALHNAERVLEAVSCILVDGLNYAISAHGGRGASNSRLADMFAIPINAAAMGGGTRLHAPVQYHGVRISMPFAQDSVLFRAGIDGQVPLDDRQLAGILDLGPGAAIGTPKFTGAKRFLRSVQATLHYTVLHHLPQLLAESYKPAWRNFVEVHHLAYRHNVTAAQENPRLPSGELDFGQSTVTTPLPSIAECVAWILKDRTNDQPVCGCGPQGM